MQENDVFEEVRPQEIQRIVKDYPLACIVTNTSDGLYATHVPLMFKSDNYLFGHVAKVNDLFRKTVDEQEVLCIFKGDDTYISANYYPSKLKDHKKVPTWNYQVVHIHGKIKFFDDQKSKLAALGRLTKESEEKVNGHNAWKMSDAPKDYLMSLLDDLIVFEVHIYKILAQSKLSQNREARDFEGVVQALSVKGKEGIVTSMLNLKK